MENKAKNVFLPVSSMCFQDKHICIPSVLASFNVVHSRFLTCLLSVSRNYFSTVSRRAFFHICVGVLETVLEILQGVRTKQPPQHPEKLMITSDIKNLFSQIIGDILWHSFQHGIVTSFLTFKEGRNPFWMLIINPIPCPCLGAGETIHFSVPS